MNTILYVLAAIGIAWFALNVIRPIGWAALYATGKTIFLCRVARAVGTSTMREITMAISIAWWEGFVEGLFGWPCSEYRVGKFRWVPLFRFYGFNTKEPT